MSHRWEYEVTELAANLWGAVDHTKLKEHFNTLGRQGWELVELSASPLSGKPVAIFKRPVA